MIDGNAPDIIFHAARSQDRWRDSPVGDEQLQQIYELTRWGPTCANGCPMRIVFREDSEAIQQLVSVTPDVNKDKVRQAPVSVHINFTGEPIF